MQVLQVGIFKCLLIMSRVERKTFAFSLLQSDSKVVGCVLIPRVEDLKKNLNTKIPSLNPEYFPFFKMVYTEFYSG